ncbi:MAG: hypothetical protein EOO38_00280 [Cytophagaceae bacterium]|nr:MAG: hypothetical protein EOO38_00280 [Cytophagaceae bacterium]
MGIYRKSHCTIEEKRSALALLSNGLSAKEVAARFNVAKSTVHTWRSQSDAGELESAASKKRAVRDAMLGHDVALADDLAGQRGNVEMNPESVSLGMLRPEFESTRIINELQCKMDVTLRQLHEVIEENALLRAVCAHFFKRTGPLR